MRGNRWQKLIKAYKHIIAKLSKGYKNKISVVNLGQNKATLEFEMMTPTAARLNPLHFLGGGTKFKPGIEAVNKLIKKTPKNLRIIIFMFSDGEDMVPKAEMKEMLELKKEFSFFQFYAIGVEATVSMMMLMAKMVDGKFFKVAKAELLSSKLANILFDTYSEFD